jgi:enterochelin esterase-like enzyme
MHLSLAFAIATLVSGFHAERSLAAGEKHIYQVSLAGGEALLATIEQKSIATVVEIEGPGQTATMRSASIDFTALLGGDYRLTVTAADSGTYVLRVDRILNAAENAKRLMQASLPSPKLYDLWLASLTDAAAIDRFLATRANAPAAFEVVPINATESRVIYVVGGDDDTERVVMNGGPEFGVLMRRLGKTNLFFGTQIVPNDARFDYSFALREVHHAGQVEVTDIVSRGPWLLEMPQAPPQPETVADASIAHGRLTRTSIRSKRLNEEREIVVYTPAAYDGKTMCNLLIALDGDVYDARIPAATILDHLIASRRIAATIAVLVMPMGKRNRDLTGSPDFASFVAEELVPWVRANYAIGEGSKRVAVAGLSFGGFGAAYCAMRHPAVLGNVISQSGAFWITKDWQSVRPPYPHDTGMLIEAFKQSERLPIRFYIEVGRFDLGAAILGSNRELRDVLQVKGYDVVYREFDGGHDVAEWRGSFAGAVESIFVARLD